MSKYTLIQDENKIKTFSDKAQDRKFWKNYQSIYFSKKETKSRRKEWNSGTKDDETILASSLI